MSEVKDFKVGDHVQYFKSRRGVSTLGIYEAVVVSVTKKRVGIKYASPNGVKRAIVPPEALQKPALKGG